MVPSSGGPANAEKQQEPIVDSGDESEDGDEKCVSSLTVKRARVSHDSPPFDAVTSEKAARIKHCPQMPGDAAVTAATMNTGSSTAAGSAPPPPPPATLTEGVVDRKNLAALEFVQISNKTTAAALVPKEDIVHAVFKDDDDEPLKSFKVPFGRAKEGSGLKGNVANKVELQEKMLQEDPKRMLRSVILVRLKPEHGSSNNKQISMQAMLPVELADDETMTADAACMINELDKNLPGGYTLVFALNPKIVAKMYNITRHGLPLKYAPNGNLVKYKAIKEVHSERAGSSWQPGCQSSANCRRPRRRQQQQRGQAQQGRRVSRRRDRRGRRDRRDSEAAPDEADSASGDAAHASTDATEDAENAAAAAPPFKRAKGGGGLGGGGLGGDGSAAGASATCPRCDVAGRARGAAAAPAPQPRLRPRRRCPQPQPRPRPRQAPAAAAAAPRPRQRRPRPRQRRRSRGSGARSRGGGARSCGGGGARSGARSHSGGDEVGGDRLDLAPGVGRRRRKLRGRGEPASDLQERAQHARLEDYALRAGQGHVSAAFVEEFPAHLRHERCAVFVLITTTMMNRMTVMMTTVVCAARTRVRPRDRGLDEISSCGKQIKKTTGIAQVKRGTRDVPACACGVCVCVCAHACRLIE